MTLSRISYWTLIVLMVCLCLGLSVALSLVRAPAIPALQLDRYRCEMASGPSEKTETVFRILTTTNMRARELADALCHSTVMTRHYDAVEISWQPRGQLTTADLTAQRYDLLWNRRRVLRGLLAGFERYYSVLQSTPKYSVYWLSRDEKPRLTAAWFADKQVGLIHDTQSQSSYQLPVGQLQSAHITLHEEQLRYFDDRRSLYHAFLTGEVDVISGLAQLGDRMIPESRRLPIAEDIPTGHWYVSERAMSDGLRCDLLRALDVMTPLYHAVDPTFEPDSAGCHR